jgi:phosphatidylinositol 3-kinase
MNLIKITDNLLKKENMEIPIITYEIIPINKSTGIIEIVENCSSLFEVTNTTSLNTFLIKHNQDKQIGNLNDTYMKSLAYWTIITYLFGIGDRHLENIMITNNGIIFHIDFSFILGQEAKILVPYIRMSEQLIEVMGGRDAKYNEFKNLCSKIFLCLRKYYIQFAELFLLLLQFQIPIEYFNFDHSYIENQIITRFLPGLSDKEAVNIIDDLIENSCDTFGQKMSDYLHYYYKKTTVIDKVSPKNSISRMGDFISKVDVSKVSKWFGY